MIDLTWNRSDAVHRFAEFPRGGLVRMAPIGSTHGLPHDELVLFIKRKSHYSLIFEFFQWRYQFSKYPLREFHHEINPPNST